MVIRFILIVLFCFSAGPQAQLLAGQAADSGKQTFYINPYLQDVTTQDISVLWWTYPENGTDCVKENKVTYWKKNTDESTAPVMQNSGLMAAQYVESVGACLSEIRLTGLAAGTLYGYQVASGTLESSEYTFKTAMSGDAWKSDDPNRGAMSFVVLGDGRTDNDRVIRTHREVAALAQDFSPDIGFNLGDGVGRGVQAQWESYWQDIMTDTGSGIAFADNIPYYLVVGNHEIADDKGFNAGNLSTTMARWKAYAANPPNNSKNPDWEERYYSFQYGPATFIILDTNNADNSHYDNNQPLPNGSTPDWAPYAEQYNWLINALKQAQKTSAFTFVMMHQSPFTSGVHGQPGEEQTGYYIRILDPMFRYFGVDGVFSSHDHLVERSLCGPPGFEAKMDQTDPANLNYFVMGNSGYDSRYPQANWESWMSINNDRKPPYYSVYFYDWYRQAAGAGYGPGTNLSYCLTNTCYFSFWHVALEKAGKGKWQATFKVVRTDRKEFDEFSIIRDVPVSALAPAE